ncbi:MAG: hypothetical protein ABIV50_04170 [Opitutus sp.]
MRSISTMCFLLAAGLVSARAADVEFIRVWPSWRDATSFERISEYFTGEENNGREVVLRTHADQRGGFYYLVRVKNSGSEQVGAQFVLHVVMPTSPEVRVITFAAAVPHRTRVFELGLTGADWPTKDTHPVAWKLELRSADDQLLASSQSFLWEKPAK